MTPQTLRITSLLILVLAQALLIHTDVIAPFAGDYYLGDGGNPTRATFYTPYGVAVDSANNLVYIADTIDHIIRVVNRTSNIISTVAGTHMFPGSSGDGKR
jgi:DNA-binding beta-propeller fold protein YncE